MDHNLIDEIVKATIERCGDAVKTIRELSKNDCTCCRAAEFNVRGLVHAKETEERWRLAAPEMYWALVVAREAFASALDVIEDYPEMPAWRGALSKMDAAIAKAELRDDRS